MPRHFLIFLLFTGAYFLSYFYRSANAIIAPDLREELQLTAADLGLMTSVFFAAFATMQLPLGKTLDRFGVRWVSSTLLWVAVAGSLIFSMSDSLSGVLSGRVLIGIGMAGGLMGAIKVFSQWYEPRQFTTMTGLLVGIGSTGALFAATPLAWLNETVGWRAVFSGGAVVLGVVVLLLMVVVRDAPDDTEKASPQPSEGWGHIFGDRTFWKIALLNFALGGNLLAFQGLWAGPYLFDVYQMSALHVGNFLLVMGVATTAGYLASGWLGGHWGLRNILILGATIFLFSQLLLMLKMEAWTLGLAYAAFGFSGALGLMTLAEIKQVMPLSMTGTAVTSVNLFGIGGTFLIQWLSGLIIGASSTSAGTYSPGAYQYALLMMAGVTLLALIFYAWPSSKNKTGMK